MCPDGDESTTKVDDLQEVTDRVRIVGIGKLLSSVPSLFKRQRYANRNGVEIVNSALANLLEGIGADYDQRFRNCSKTIKNTVPGAKVSWW